MKSYNRDCESSIRLRSHLIKYKGKIIAIGKECQSGVSYPNLIQQSAKYGKIRKKILSKKR